MLRWSRLFLFTQAVSITARGLDREEEDATDLCSYISSHFRTAGLTTSKRPDIRAPKLELKIHNKDAVTPGYIFTAPYSRVNERGLVGPYQPLQIGPHIYDTYGDLVWSGAEFTHNRNAYDFKSTAINGSMYLTFIYQAAPGKNDPGHGSTGFILDSQFQVFNNISLHEGFNMHEFTTIDNAKAFLKISTMRHTSAELIPGQNVTVLDTCACEVDTEGHESFRFCPTDGIALQESMIAFPEGSRPGTKEPDVFHMNSVDKFPNGDYLVSIRYTSAIYRISKQGKVVWRLGGRKSDFLQDFNFTGQHDARVVSENSTITVLSIFDNASTNDDHIPQSAQSSSFKVVALYEHQSRRRAMLLKQFDSPNDQLTRLRGNGQLLPTGGAFVGWSAQSYMSEFGPNGDVLLEGQFHSTRFNSYRVFKSIFRGMPTRPPDLKAFLSISSNAGVSLLCFVSWNGATEVASWEFLGSNEEGRQFKSLGLASRTGFETSFAAPGTWRYVRAQARDKHGNALGASKTQDIKPLRGFPSDKFTEQVPDRLAVEQPTSVPMQMWRLSRPGGLFLIITPIGFLVAWLVYARRSTRKTLRLLRR